MYGFTSITEKEFCLYIETRAEANMIISLLNTKARTELAGKAYDDVMSTLTIVKNLEGFAEKIEANSEKMKISPLEEFLKDDEPDLIDEFLPEVKA